MFFKGVERAINLTCLDFWKIKHAVLDFNMTSLKEKDLMSKNYEGRSSSEATAFVSRSTGPI